MPSGVTVSHHELPVEDRAGHKGDPALGQLALQHSRRRNLMLFSLYVTELGGERILPNWVLPRYHALTLAGAGRFLLLRTGQDNGASRHEKL